MAGRLPRVTGATGSVDTAGQGYFIGVAINGLVTSASVIVENVDEVRLFSFVLPFRIVVGNIATEVTTGGGAGKKYGIGLYNTNGKLALETGALDANTVQTNSTSITAVTLEPGHYWMAQTSDSATTQLRTLSISQNLRALLNLDVVQEGNAANTSSAGVLAATTGAITTKANRLPAAATFSP